MTVRTAIWPEIKKLASERVDIRKPKSYGPNGSHGFSCEVWFDGKPLGYVEHHGRGEAHSVRCTADVKEQRDNFKAFIASLPNLYDPLDSQPAEGLRMNEDNFLGSWASYWIEEKQLRRECAKGVVAFDSAGNMYLYKAHYTPAIAAAIRAKDPTIIEIVNERFLS